MDSSNPMRLAPNPIISRRRFVATVLGSAAIGATWTTGLAELARGRHPQIFAVGDDRWQVLLIEHGSARIVLLSGVFERSPEPEIDLLCGLLRQHIDLVAGTSAALGFLSRQFRKRRSVSTVIQLDGAAMLGASTRFRPLVEPLKLSGGNLDLTLRPIPNGHWSEAVPDFPEWIGHLSSGPIGIAIARNLSVIARYGHPDSGLAIAPVGDIDILHGTLPTIAVAANADSVNEWRAAGWKNDPESRTAVWTTRTFRQDIGAFVLRNGEIRLPAWSQQLSPDTR